MQHCWIPVGLNLPCPLLCSSADLLAAHPASERSLVDWVAGRISYASRSTPRRALPALGGDTGWMASVDGFLRNLLASPAWRHQSVRFDTSSIWPASWKGTGGSLRSQASFEDLDRHPARLDNFCHYRSRMASPSALDSSEGRSQNILCVHPLCKNSSANPPFAVRLFRLSSKIFELLGVQSLARADAASSTDIFDGTAI